MERQQLWFSISHNRRAMEHRDPIFNLSADFVGNHASDDMATIPQKCASTERQRFLVLHLAHSKGYGMS